MWIAGSTLVARWSEVFGVNWRIDPSCSSCSDMLHQKRQQDAERTEVESAPKRIRGSAAGRGMEAGFKADPVSRSHCSTWQTKSLKEPTSEDTEPYPWRMPIPAGELELAPTMPLPRGYNRAVASSDGHEIRLAAD